MAIVRMGGEGGGLAKKSAGLTPAKGAKHVAKGAKKHAAKKHPAKKHAAKEAKHAAKGAKHAARTLIDELGGPRGTDEGMALAFHSLHRAGAVISLLEGESGGDLKGLLEHGIELYRKACKGQSEERTVACAAGILRAAEHLAMAGLYAARGEYRAEVKAPALRLVEKHLEELGPRLDELAPAKKAHAERLEAMARELLRRAEGAGDDPHLEYELTMAADGILLGAGGRFVER